MKFPIPIWYKEFYSQFKAQNFFQFLFDGNINDKFFWPSQWDSDKTSQGSLYSFKEFLLRRLIQAKIVVIYYSVTMGIKIFRQFEDINIFFSDSEENINNLQKIEIEVRNCNPESILSDLQRLEKYLFTSWKEQENPVYIATIIDHFETILRDPLSLYYERYITELIENWGVKLQQIKLNNISILITENRELLPSNFRTNSNGTYPIRVDYPSTSYRKLYFNSLKEQKNFKISKLLEDKDFISNIINLTKGFRIIDCEEIVSIYETSVEDSQTKIYFFGDKKDEIEKEDIIILVKNQKKDVIESLSKRMLISVDSNITFNEIGGLEEVKNYFKKIAEAIKLSSENPSYREIIPKGVLLVGPPGTGKTLIAKALAKEAGINLVKMGDIRSMWVGESEKNMTLVLNLLKVMAPVIVFIDEIDQAIGRRSQNSGDSGVSGRIFGKILEFMGDNENRGKVIWIAATNRADLLDDAMIRRFDGIIPVLLPGSKEEWIAVIKGIFNQILKSAKTQVKIEENVIKSFVEKNLTSLRRNHSGSSIEIVIRKVYDEAILFDKKEIDIDIFQKVFDNFKTNFNWEVYKLQTLISISACNDLRFIKLPGDDYSYGEEEIDRLIKEVIEKKTNDPLLKKIRELKYQEYR